MNKNLAKLFTTLWFGQKMPAPGTFGSLFAVGTSFLFFGNSHFLLIGILLVSLLGYFACLEMVKGASNQDPGEIIIDEVVGQWIALLPALSSYNLMILSFLLFRVFDILKPWPVSWCNHAFKGKPAVSAFGIMIDDIVAGLLAALLIFSLKHYHVI